MGEPPSRTLHVSQLPDDLPEVAFRGAFMSCDGCSATRLRNNRTGHQMGFVDFDSVDHAIKARTKLEGFKFSEAHAGIRIQFAKTKLPSGTRADSREDRAAKRPRTEMARQQPRGRPNAHSSAQSAQRTEPSPTLFIDGVPTDAKERELAHVFRPFHGFVEVRMKTKDDGHKVLCFAEFDSTDQALAAQAALQGYLFDYKDTGARPGHGGGQGDGRISISFAKHNLRQGPAAARAAARGASLPRSSHPRDPASSSSTSSRGPQPPQPQHRSHDTPHARYDGNQQIYGFEGGPAPGSGAPPHPHSQAPGPRIHDHNGGSQSIPPRHMQQTPYHSQYPHRDHAYGVDGPSHSPPTADARYQHDTHHRPPPSSSASAFPRDHRDHGSVAEHGVPPPGYPPSSGPAPSRHEQTQSQAYGDHRQSQSPASQMQIYYGGGETSSVGMSVAPHPHHASHGLHSPDRPPSYRGGMPAPAPLVPSGYDRHGTEQHRSQYPPQQSQGQNHGQPPPRGPAPGHTPQYPHGHPHGPASSESGAYDPSQPYAAPGPTGIADHGGRPGMSSDPRFS